MVSLRESFPLFCPEGSVVEIRGLKTPDGVVSGYFDNVTDAERAVLHYGNVGNFYITANPVSPDLLESARNVLRSKVSVTTTDKQVVSRHWFLLDFDPVRPPNVASTDEELKNAIHVRSECVRWLTERGWPEPVLAISGNGAHALYSVNLPNTKEVTELFKTVLNILSAKFSTADVTLDTSVFNPARIWRLYGTVNHKGVASHDRPHRMASLEFIPSPIVAVKSVQFQTLLPAVGTFDFVGLFKQQKLYIRYLGHGKHAVHCPWKSAHTDDSGITQTVLFDPTSADAIEGNWGFECKHSHCVDRTIADVRKFFDIGIFIKSRNGRILANHQDNIQRALRLMDVTAKYNEFADRLLINGERMEDRQLTEIWLRIDSSYHFRPEYSFFEKVVKFIAWNARYHPVRDYLNGLEWDGYERLDRWIIDSAQAANTEYVRAISAIMLIAAVRRVRQPGCKYDEMVVWESPQGSNKSSAVRALCPVAEWFSDDLRLNLHSREIIEATLGKWIIEASDLAGKRKTEIEQLKAMLSRQVDGPARMAYAHLPVERARQFILIGTTNSAAYLTDTTGGRRFWPMKVHRFDVDWITENRNQLWAEACVRETRGESIRLDESLWPVATRHQERRREVDPWETVILEHLLQMDTTSDGKRRVTAETLWSTVGLPVERRDRIGALRIADIMQRLGFKRTTVRVGDIVHRGYVTEYPELLDVPEEADDPREPGEEG